MCTNEAGCLCFILSVVGFITNATDRFNDDEVSELPKPHSALKSLLLFCWQGGHMSAGASTSVILRPGPDEVRAGGHRSFCTSAE